MNNPSFPITRSLSSVFALSLVVAVLVAAAALAGLLFPSAVYTTDELRRSFLTNDVVNLFIGLPSLLASLWLARRGQLIGLLFWPGALLYTAYNSIAYAVAMPLSLSFVVNLTLALLSLYLIYQLLTGMDMAAVRARLHGNVPESFGGGVLAGFGALFFFMRVGIVATALAGAGLPGNAEAAVAVADLFMMPAWVIGGISLWRKQAFGYVGGVGLLFQGSMLFVGLLVFFILQPFVAGGPFPVEDFVVIAAMGLICFIPFGLFVRGAARP